jgi:hypothetical protein
MTVRPTKIPGIPKPPVSAGPELRRYLESLAEAVEIRLGRKGDPRDRAITLRELIASGLARELRGNPFNPNNPGTLPDFTSDNDVDVTVVPPQPTGFTADGAYSVVNLYWDFPLYTGPNHSHTEIYSYPSDNLASAIAQGVIGVITGRAYTDPVGEGVTRYYWIRHVNEHGTVGPWNSGSGTLAETAPDVEHLLDVLTDAITDSELAASLSGPISQIPGIQNTLTSINTDLTGINTDITGINTDLTGINTDITGINTDLTGINSSISGLTSNVNTLTSNQANFATTTQLGAYVTTTYLTSNYYTLNEVDQAITAKITDFNSNTIGPNYTNTADLNTNFYTKTNADLAISAAITNYNTNTIGPNYTNTADLTTNYYTKTNADLAISAAITNYNTNTIGPNYTNTADLTTNYYTRTNADNAISAAITYYNTNTIGPNYTNTSDLNTNFYTKTDADNAISAAISNYNTNTIGVNYTTTADLTVNYYTKTSADNAISAAISNYNTNTIGVNYTNTADLTTNYYTKTSADLAISAAITNYNTNTIGVNYTNTADLTTNYYTKTNADSAISTAINNYNTNTIGVNYTTTADLTTNYYTKTDADTAFASTSDILNAQVDNPDGSSNQVSLAQAATVQASTNGDLKGQYTVKVDANGHVAGFGLANTSTSSGGSTSEFFVNADKFAVLPDAVTSADSAWSSSGSYSQGNRVTHNGKLYQARISHTSYSTRVPPNASYWDDLSIAPFAVTSSGSTVDGTYVPAGVYINSAMIKHASITAAQIGSVNADTITTGDLDVTNLLTANSIDASKLVIDGSTITSVVVGGKPTLQLGDVSANSIKTGTLNASLITVTNLYADNISGDINTLVPFSLASPVQITGNDTQVWSGQFPAAGTNGKAKKPYISVVGYGIWENDVVYKVKLQMKVNSSPSAATVGTCISNTLQNYGNAFWHEATFSGDKRSVVPAGATLRIGSSIRGTVLGATYNATSNVTSVIYTALNTGLQANNTVTATPTVAYQTVSTIFFRANFDDHPEPFAISGGLSAGVTASVDARIMFDTYTRSYQQIPSTPHTTNWTHDQVFDLDGLMMSLR